MSEEPSTQIGFSELGLSDRVLKALEKVGYETPTSVQAQIIPHFMNDRDLIGQAQTGTGKTAAFALPLLTKISLKIKNPQVLVLAPTRELAIQVAEAFQKYASQMNNFHVLPIYGGQDYQGQIRRLKRGVHVVVGTPGRVMDHMKRGTLDLSNLTCLVLDEADEMLSMGFIEDIEWVLSQLPSQHQIALFSATMPNQIRRISRKYLNDPVEIKIKTKTTTVETTRQRYWMVSGFHKLDALTRILEVEKFDGVIVFVRTKSGTVELAEKLEARGYRVSPLNGDMQQSKREKTIEMLKNEKFNILVATDVAARGLDVERISHVINYDIPYDTEAYIHRIGRTGRAGRSGEAILFVSPRERRMLKAIEKATRQKIEVMHLPSTETINDQRISRFKDRISEALDGNLDFYREILDQYLQEQNVPAMEIAAALAKLVQGDTPLLLSKKAPREKPLRERSQDDRSRRDSRSRGDRSGKRSGAKRLSPEVGMDTYRIEVGHNDDVKPGNIVGAIANEAGLESDYIGRIYIYDDHSTVDLPEGMPASTMRILENAWVGGKQMTISKIDGSSGGASGKKESGKNPRSNIKGKKRKMSPANKRRKREKK